MSVKFIDITVGLSTEVAPWPGDNPLRWNWPLHIGPECPINLSSISFSPHLGTHVDAPLHYVPGGPTAEKIPLQTLIGYCLVVDIGPGKEEGHTIDTGTIKTQMPANAASGDGPVRVLLKTGYERQNPFNTTFRHPAPEAVTWLARQGVILLGTDAPSMDHFHSKTLDAHRACHRHGITILENL